MPIGYAAEQTGSFTNSLRSDHFTNRLRSALRPGGSGNCLQFPHRRYILENMYRLFQKTKSVIALLFVLTLLGFSIAGIKTDVRSTFAPAESRASISTDLLSAPVLPVSEAEIEKSASHFGHQGLPARYSYQAGLAILIGFLFLSMPVLSYRTFIRISQAGQTDQFRKSTIRYIHRKSDQA